MKRLETLIFDLDGTLIDSREDIAKAVNHALKTLNLPQLPVETIAKYVGEGTSMLLLRSLPPGRDDLLEESLKIFRAYYRDHLLDHTKLRRNAKEILEHFRDRKKAVVSNKPRDPSVEILKGLGVLHHFQMVLGGESVSNRKPHPEAILKVLKELNSKGSEAMIIGDGYTDILAGKNAGIATCLITGGGLGDTTKLNSVEPDFIIDDLMELKGIVI
ncbi:MAG: HAD family hydrolase [bacterium]